MDRGWGIIRFLLAAGPYLRPHAIKVAEVLVYIGLSVAFTMLLPFTQKWLIDRALLPGDQAELLRIMAGITVLFVVVSITSLRANYVAAWVSERVLQELRLRTFALLQRMESAFFQRFQTGDILSCISSDLLAVQFAFTSALAEGLRLTLTLLASLILLFSLDWKLGLLGVAGLPLYFLTTRFLGPPAARASLQRQQDLAATTSTVQEDLLAQPVVKAFGLEEQTIAAYHAQLSRLFRSSLRLTFLSSLYGLSANSITYAVQLTILGVGGYLIMEGTLTLGSLIAFLSLLAQVIGPVQALSGIVQELQQATGAMERVNELLRQVPAIIDREGAQPLPRLSRAIRLEGVSFSYTGRQQALADVRLEIPAGAKVALVGPTGAGKSTVLNLLMRFYDPQAGRVTFDGTDLRDAALASLRGQIGVVFQDSFLFDTSIRENIRLGRPDATDAEVEAAAQVAEIHDRILALPLGYDTPVGERGCQLSGGERQRIAIARAILRHPSVLVLDEATSALDPQTEAAIMKTLGWLSVGRTVIMITHRLAAAARMDRIYVLDCGRLVEWGSHAELLYRGGLYARLWQEQTGRVKGAIAQAHPLAAIPHRGGLETALVSSVPFLARLAPSLLAALLDRMTMAQYAPGDIVVSGGAHGDTLYFIRHGEAEAVTSSPAGETRRLTKLSEGNAFGELLLLCDILRLTGLEEGFAGVEIALLYDVRRTAMIRAVTRLQVLALSREALEELLLTLLCSRSMPEGTTLTERVPALAVATAVPSRED